MLSLKAQRVVVVGGTSGMGRATVEAALEQGATVVSAGRRPVGARPATDGVTEVELDVTSEASVRDLFAGLGAIDHVLVTASPGTPGAFLDQDLAGARQFMDGKFFGSWLVARHAAPQLRAGGSITFITGAAVMRPPPRGSMITAAFAALEALTRALALELGPIRVNAIRPGYTDSEMWQFLSDAARDDLRRRVAAAMPTRRMGTPADIAHAAMFLMTSPQTTGAVLEVSGGETLVNPLDG